MSGARLNCPLVMLKSMPIVRAAVRFTSATRDHEHDLLLARHAQEIDEVRVSLQDLADGIDRGLLVAQAGDERHINIPGIDLAASCRGRMFRNDAEDLCRLDSILRFAAHHDLLADQRKLNCAVGECFLDFPFQDLEGLLEGFHLRLQTFPLFHHVRAPRVPDRARPLPCSSRCGPCAGRLARADRETKDQGRSCPLSCRR